MKHYLRIFCGLLITLSAQAFLPAHAYVVSYTIDQPIDLDDARSATVFKEPDHPEGDRSMRGRPLSLDKEWFADEWQGRDARFLFPVEKLENARFEGFLQQWQKQNGADWFHPDEDWKWQYLKVWLENQDGPYDAWKDWWQDHKDGSTEVPIPASVWLLGSAIGLLGFRSFKKKHNQSG